MKVKMCKEILEQEGWSSIYQGVPIYGRVKYVEKDVSPLMRYLLDGKRIHKLLMQVLLVHFKRKLKKIKEVAEIGYEYAGPLYDNSGEYINQYIVIQFLLNDPKASDFPFREYIWFEVRA